MFVASSNVSPAFFGAATKRRNSRDLLQRYFCPRHEISFKPLVDQLATVVGEHFDRHPAAEIYLSQPGLGVVLAARTLGEFGDDTARFADARARKNYSGQSPITRASGKKSIVLARYATNRRLGAALHQQAFSALSRSPGARAYYDAIRANVSREKIAAGPLSVWRYRRLQ